ncbi:MAG: MlaD family protein [Candidatus Accumulibacter sp.]|jgi:phospholipid/cholesterol/gamma-HCH transport system substrate-binding protein|nr:MlaD family protein [Accumulibacter sp.]
MENRSHALMAGAFTLLLGIAVVFAVWWFGGTREAMDDYIVTTSASISGLSVQGQVRYRGVRVGRVVSIEFDPANPGSTLIHIRVRQGVPITKGTVAQLGSQGVTGIAHILLDETEKNADPLVAPEGGLPRIPMRKTLSLNEIASAGSATLGDLQDVLTSVNEILGPENRKKISTTLSNLETASVNAREVSERLRSFMTPENIRRLDAVLAGAGKTVGEAAPFFAEARGLVARLESAGNKLDLALGSPSDASGAPALRIDEIGSELTTSLRELNRVLQKIEESPQGIIFGYKKQAGPGEPGFVEPGREGKDSP